MNKSKKQKYLVIKFFLFLIIIIILLRIHIIYGNIDTYQNNINEIKNVSLDDKKNKEINITEMLQRVMPTVVGISKIKNTGITVLNQNNTKELGIGSGVIISNKGYILTNEHVSGAKYSTCYVTLENGEIISANVIWSDEKLDLAIIKVNQQFTNYTEIGDSENIQVGQIVYAIGNPIGMEFQRTVTSGIISAKNRTINFEENGQKIYMSNLLQTDATINPGNSGGPLINIYGEIIGINTIKITSAEGIGFAVPTNIIKPIIQKLENNGKFDEASIGVLVYDSDIIKYLGIQNKIEKGVYVVENTLDNQLLKGDIIIAIDDIEIKNINVLKQYVYAKEPGDEVKITFLRNNKKYEKNIKLRKK